MNDDFRRGLCRVADAFGQHELIFDLVANLKRHSEHLVVEPERVKGFETTAIRY